VESLLSVLAAMRLVQMHRHLHVDSYLSLMPWVAVAIRYNHNGFFDRLRLYWRTSGSFVVIE
jgi:hypothetical protein